MHEKSADSVYFTKTGSGKKHETPGKRQRGKGRTRALTGPTKQSKKGRLWETCLFCFFMFMMKRLAPCGGAFLYENSIKADCGEGLSGR